MSAYSEMAARFAGLGERLGAFNADGSMTDEFAARVASARTCCPLMDAAAACLASGATEYEARFFASLAGHAMKASMPPDEFERMIDHAVREHGGARGKPIADMLAESGAGLGL